ncbi:MAG: hypothetical protein H7Y03_14135 [Chitinophagaceae bacterium]|nr:hypothetical protein [Chitinophagaceae bacterium]
MRQVNVYPNPFYSKISIELSSEGYENAIVSLTNDGNQIIKMFSWPLKPGTNKTALETLDALSEGTYTIAIKEETGKIISSVLIDKQPKKT